VVAGTLWVIWKISTWAALVSLTMMTVTHSTEGCRERGIWDWTDKTPMLGPTGTPPTKVFDHCCYNIPSLP